MYKVDSASEILDRILSQVCFWIARSYNNGINFLPILTFGNLKEAYLLPGWHGQWSGLEQSNGLLLWLASCTHWQSGHPWCAVCQASPVLIFFSRKLSWHEACRKSRKRRVSDLQVFFRREPQSENRRLCLRQLQAALCCPCSSMTSSQN